MFLCICCESQIHRNEQNCNLIKISFATGGCYGRCPILAIKIDNQLNYNFYSRKYTDSIGYFSGKASTQLLDTLCSYLDKINLQQLDVNGEEVVDDLRLELIIQYGQNIKRLRGSEMNFPKVILPLCEILLNSYKSINLTRIDSSAIRFETKLQFPIPPPPPVRPLSDSENQRIIDSILNLKMSN